MAQETEKAEYEAKERMGTLGNEEMVTHILNLAPNTPYLSINGRRWYHGATVTEKKSVVDALRDMEFQGWRQEEIRNTGGSGKNAFGIDRKNPASQGVVRA